MSRLETPELSMLQGVARTCSCCPSPAYCCDYCRVQFAWTVVASASKTVGSVTEQINWNTSLIMTWLRNDDPSAPTFPKTFRSSEAEGLEECELLSNSGPFEHTIESSYTWTQTTSGIETDREEVDLTPWVGSVHVRINCDNESFEYAGTTHPTTGQWVPTTAVSVYLVGDPLSPNSLPLEWAHYFDPGYKLFSNIGATTPGMEIINTTETGELSGWDSDSLSDTASIIITPCTAEVSSDVLTESGGRMLMETGETLILE